MVTLKRHMTLRSTLNGTTYNSLSIKDKIKQVQKEFIPTYNSASRDQFIEYGITQNEARLNNIKLYATERGKSVRLWRYNPRTLASDGYADILSIILSYPQYDRSWAASRLLPHVKWADVITSE